MPSRSAGPNGSGDEAAGLDAHLRRRVRLHPSRPPPIELGSFAVCYRSSQDGHCYYIPVADRRKAFDLFEQLLNEPQVHKAHVKRPNREGLSPVVWVVLRVGEKDWSVVRDTRGAWLTGYGH